MNKVGGPLLSVAGMTSAQRRRMSIRCTQGDLVRLVSGIYLDSTIWVELSESERRQARIVAHAAAAPSTVVVGRSAAQLWRLPLAEFRHEPTVELAATSKQGGSRRRGAVIFRSGRHVQDQVRHLTSQFGTVRVTDVPTTGIDLARWHSLDDAVVAMDLASQRGRLAHADLTRAAEARRGAKGMVVTRDLLNLVTSQSESPRESELKLQMWRAGLPPPFQQTRFVDKAGEFVARSDFFFEVGIAVEYHGQGKFKGEFGEDPALAMRRKMERQDRLLELGVVLVNVERDGFADGSAVGLIQRHHEHLSERGAGVERRFWTPGVPAWRVTGM